MNSVLKFVVCFKLLCFVLIVISSSSIPNFGDDIELSQKGRIDAFQPPLSFQSRDNDTSAIEKHLLSFVEGFTNWDSQYYLFISKYGYQTENHYAFFPLWAILLWLPQKFLERYPLWGYLATVFWGLAVNVTCAIITVNFLERIRQLCGKKHPQKHFLFTCLVLLNPASIFFNVLYTESLYLCLTVVATYFLLEQRPFVSCWLFHLASFTRANGIVNAGFFFFLAFVQIYKMERTNIFIYCGQIYKYTIYASFISVPYVWMQFYAYLDKCFGSFELDVLPRNVADYLELERKLTGIKEGLWCDYSVPFVYNYIQKAYWNNGFLNYYTLNNIPNFVLAFPMACFVPIVLASSSELQKFNYRDYVQSLKAMKHEQLVIFAAYIQLFVLYMFSLLFMNIQVMTRLLFSGCPILYIFVVEMLTADFKSAKIASSGKSCVRDLISAKFWLMHRRSRFFIQWAMAYSILGIVLHPNRLPWT